MLKDYATPELLYNLANYGFELGLTAKQSATIEKEEFSEQSIEELVITILTENPEPVFIEGIPVILGKNSVDYSKLFQLATERKCVKKLGWILSVSEDCYTEENISYNSSLTDTISRCEQAIDGVEETIAIEPPKSFFDLSLRLRDDIAIKWNITAHYPKSRIKEHMNLYIGRQNFV